MKLLKWFKSNPTAILMILIVLFILWIWLTNIIQAFCCPSMTQTQLFLHIFKSMMLKFNYCK